MIISDFQPKYLTVLSVATACDEVSCPKGIKCAIDERHKPVCVCWLENCPYSTDIVCGSDGRTYGSECELLKKACTSGKNVRVAHKGYCLEGESAVPAVKALSSVN